MKCSYPEIQRKKIKPNKQNQTTNQQKNTQQNKQRNKQNNTTAKPQSKQNKLKIHWQQILAVFIKSSVSHVYSYVSFLL